MNALTVLTVDDSSDDTLLFQRACRKSGASFQLQTVNGGQGAIDYLSGADVFSDRQRFPLPQLMLLDLKMPKKDGFEVLDWVRQQTGSRVPVAIFSSSQNQKDIEQAYQMGANWYLMKPLDYAELVQIAATINSYLATLDPALLGTLRTFRSLA